MSATDTTNVLTPEFVIPTPLTGPVERNMRGELRQVTTAMLTPTKRLSVHTSKRHDGVLMTTATVAIVEEGSVWESHRVYHDFSRCLDRERMRVTVSAVGKQHAACIAGNEWADICTMARTHYMTLGEWDGVDV